METLKFRTNIKCGGCVAAVTPYLNNLQGLKKWEVDLADPGKILTVEGENGMERTVVMKLREAGYEADIFY